MFIGTLLVGESQWSNQISGSDTVTYPFIIEFIMDAFVFLRIGNSRNIIGEVSTRSIGYFTKSAVNVTAYNIFYNYYDYIVIGY